MRLDVDTGAYAGARDLLYAANHGVTDATGRLAQVLEGCAGMSGTDAGGRAWAAAYDEVAGQLVRAGADLGGSMGSCANLLNASLANHDGADYGARLFPGPVVGQGRGGRGIERLLPAELPSAFGGLADEPDGWGWLAEHLEGLLWPDADTGSMARAGAAWLDAASTLEGWSSSTDDASVVMGSQRSPEAPIAARATRELGSHGRELAAACRDVGHACEQYAEQVDESHRQVVDTCQELLTWTAVDQATGAVLSFFTGGGAEVAAQLVQTGVMARYAARVVAVLRRLVELARVAAALISRGLARITAILARLRVFLSLRTTRALERVGVIAAVHSQVTVRELLAESERLAGHTLARHVGLTDAELTLRGVRVESTYTDTRAAELGISGLLARESGRLAAWLRSGSTDDLVLNGDAGRIIGRTLTRGDATPIPTSRLRIVIRRSPLMSGDYYVHTSYPTP